MNSTHQVLFNRNDKIVDRYLIDDIRRGNMGIVYLCMDLRKNEPVAIKTFDSRFFHSEANRKNFLHEASTWIHLERHPNIVEARSLKLIDNQPYLFLERVIADNPRGATLKDLFFTQTLDYRRMLQIAIHICDGMLHALSKFPHLVHRDLKSENILFGQEGLPKISDFGMTMRPDFEDLALVDSQFDRDLPFPLSELARRMEGTPAYASPEQCQCKPLDTRSDIYSFGCILYHMATKHLPFHRSTVEETIMAHIREIPKTPTERSNIVPFDFSQLIMTCLEKNPLDRFDSFDTVRMELINLYEFRFFENPHSFQSGIPLTVEEYIERAKSFALLKKYDHGRAELMKALQLDPTRSALYYFLGQYSYMEKRYKRALLELKEALKGMSHNASLHEFLGKTYLALSFTEEAKMHFKEAIDLDSEQESAYHELISIYIERGQSQAAEEVLQQALDHCGNQISFYIRLSELYRRMKRSDLQIGILEKIVQIDPQHIDSLLQLAELYLKSKRIHQAKEWTERAVKAHPNSFSELSRVGTLYLAFENPRRASEFWKAAAATGEGDGNFYLDIAALCSSLRYYDDAWMYVLRAEEKDAEVSALKFEIQAQRLKGR